jgi:REP-associated tyrosine transposase
MRYRRAFIQGGRYFFTVVTARREPVFAGAAEVALLREAFRVEMDKRPFAIDAIVVLPDHLHCIWTLPEGDADFSTRWRLIKTWFSKHYLAKAPVTHSNRLNKEQQSIWQQRFWEHCLRDEQDFNQHVDYIHYNPVKHGYVERASLWHHSSIHRYIQHGLIDKDWGGSDMGFEDNIGKE